ncbi:MAG: hypothetical protein HN353_10695 [Bdellovibrionales bacterium]|jgi:hypothetical protein|nr:hypothetical protein [Bdellovibrionales bacterium]MBT3524762.1 hypothetical protein [Bdellovibrionales bacterium]MBT7669333.1 hypothetical protein [Bdellovibrionales bacterium]MBT7767647.1 hypothetical protein [Bdellovibrionales bacterium]
MQNKIVLLFILLLFTTVAWAIDPYKVFGLTSDATEKEIKERHRQLVKIYHEAGSNPDPEKMKLINGAREDLKKIHATGQPNSPPPKDRTKTSSSGNKNRHSGYSKTYNNHTNDFYRNTGSTSSSAKSKPTVAHRIGKHTWKYFEVFNLPPNAAPDWASHRYAQLMEQSNSGQVQAFLRDTKRYMAKELAIPSNEIDDDMVRRFVSYSRNVLTKSNLRQKAEAKLVKKYPGLYASDRFYPQTPKIKVSAPIYGGAGCWKSFDDQLPRGLNIDLSI